MSPPSPFGPHQLPKQTVGIHKQSQTYRRKAQPFVRVWGEEREGGNRGALLSQPHPHHAASSAPLRSVT